MPAMKTTGPPKIPLWMKNCHATTRLSTCKPSATTLSSLMRCTKKVRALKPTARASALWTFIVPRAGSCAVSNMVIGWNAPWGVALAPLDFGRFSHDLLIGQFAGGGDTQSSGFIAAYDLTTGKFDGLLQDASGKPLAINGVWALSPGNVNPNNNDAAAAPAGEMYFTAGPNHTTGGLLGYLTAVSAELTEGNDQ